MDVSLSFVEYDAANGLRDLSPVAFTLLSAAKLGQTANRRTWTLSGSAEAFTVLRADLRIARERFLRSSVATAVNEIIKSIDVALEESAHKPVEMPPPKAMPEGQPARAGLSLWSAVRNFATSRS